MVFPVSYTHLDVYKRQHFAQRRAGAGSILRLHGGNDSGAVAFLHLDGTPEPVESCGLLSAVHGRCLGVGAGSGALLVRYAPRTLPNRSVATGFPLSMIICRLEIHVPRRHNARHPRPRTEDTVVVVAVDRRHLPPFRP